jgi:hypothetical protein
MSAKAPIAAHATFSAADGIAPYQPLLITKPSAPVRFIA